MSATEQSMNPDSTKLQMKQHALETMETLRVRRQALVSEISNIDTCIEDQITTALAGGATWQEIGTAAGQGRAAAYTFYSRRQARNS